MCCWRSIILKRACDIAPRSTVIFFACLFHLCSSFFHMFHLVSSVFIIFILFYLVSSFFINFHVFHLFPSCFIGFHLFSSICFRLFHLFSSFFFVFHLFSSFISFSSAFMFPKKSEKLPKKLNDFLKFPWRFSPELWRLELSFGAIGAGRFFGAFAGVLGGKVSNATAWWPGHLSPKKYAYIYKYCMHLYIYMYIYIYIALSLSLCGCVCVYFCLSLSLSLSLFLCSILSYLCSFCLVSHPVADIIHVEFSLEFMCAVHSRLLTWKDAGNAARILPGLRWVSSLWFYSVKQQLIPF